MCKDFFNIDRYIYETMGFLLNSWPTLTFWWPIDHFTLMALPRVLIFIVSYNAEGFIESVINRIPEALWSDSRYELEVLVIDDQSKDNTFFKAESVARDFPNRKINVLYNPVNQGYGGNQKLGYAYAVSNQFDAVILLHGDGQYAPELLSEMISPIVDGGFDVVLGSRMLKRFNALKGGMPVYKWFGNQVLTFVQNWILGTNLAEFHTGYRAYSTKALKAIPFEKNSDDFDFDTDILIQVIERKLRIKEIAIPTYYGEEVCHVNGTKYAFQIIKSSLSSRLMKWGILYTAKFDFGDQFSNAHYDLKLNYDSSHEWALSFLKVGTRVADLGCGPGVMALEITKRKALVFSVDQKINEIALNNSALGVLQKSLDTLEAQELPDVAIVYALDVIEHLKSPEAFLQKLRQKYGGSSTKLILTTGNIAFFPMRISLLFGLFNYGKQGILDLDHTRLFTFYSLRRALQQTGFEILETKAIPAPFPKAIGNNALSKLLLKINQTMINISKSLFAYQMGFVVKAKPDLAYLLNQANLGREEKLKTPLPEFQIH